MHQLFPDGGCGTMSRKDLGFIGQLTNHSKALHHFKHRTAWQIGAPNGGTKKGIARKGHVLSGIIQDDATGSMSRRFDDGELMRAKVYPVALLQPRLNGRNRRQNIQTDKLRRLLMERCHLGQIALMHLERQAKLGVHIAIAIIVVDMAVGCNEMLRTKLLLPNIIGNHTILVGSARTAIDDNTRTRLVAHHIAIFLQRITLKNLDGQHIYWIGI